MEKKLDFGWMSTLKKIVFRRITTILWCHPSILAQIDACDMKSEFLFQLGMPDVESKVEDNMNKLLLPPLLIEQMKYLVKPIGSELKNWKNFHDVYLVTGKINMICVSKHICWSRLGLLDYAKTAENLIRHETFDTLKLYRLACLYCFDEYIRILWEKLPEESKNFFYKEEGPFEITHPQLEFCWPYILKGEESRLDYMLFNPFEERPTFNQCAFEYSAYKCNRAATEYFFRKLPCDVRTGLLFRLGVEIVTRGHQRRHLEYFYDDFPVGRIPDIVFGLLILMTPEQQMEFFKHHDYKVLVCLIYCPWQELLLDTSEFIRNFLNVDKYLYKLIQDIFAQIGLGFDVTKLFQELFLRGFSDFKNRFMENEELYVHVFCWFVKVNDSETIKFVFRELDSVQREKLVSSQPVFKLFCESISRGQWPLVELCLQEANLSKERKRELKELYARFFPDINLNVDISWIRRIWKKFRDFFDEKQVKISRKRKSDE